MMSDYEVINLLKELEFEDIRLECKLWRLCMNDFKDEKKYHEAIENCHMERLKNKMQRDIVAKILETKNSRR